MALRKSGFELAIDASIPNCNVMIKITLFVLSLLTSINSFSDTIKEYKIFSAHRFADRQEVAEELNRLAEMGWVVKAVVPRIINGGHSVTDIYLERNKAPE